ncbi:MAG: ribosomal-protein-alanine N-acetyltransferase [Betaproteobacteria bacterium RIFCSPLOWO2_02_FULL_65_24]|nr:MAG: ribosomal-protein-alanine N-acetyltransferase [Betaproteobacteria bacterium RIFCSPLOWO2_02_FULL_65_24]
MSAVLKPVIELRPMSEAGLPAVMAIENAIYAFPWTLGNFRDSLAAGYDCSAYMRNGELIGYAVVMLASAEAHLLNLSIAAGCQRQGYGSQLLRRLCEVARGQGARLMLLEVRPSNTAGLRLYERHAFQRVGLRREYYPAQAGREDALVLGLRL